MDFPPLAPESAPDTERLPKVRYRATSYKQFKHRTNPAQLRHIVTGAYLGGVGVGHATHCHARFPLLQGPPNDTPGSCVRSNLFRGRAGLVEERQDKVEFSAHARDLLSSARNETVPADRVTRTKYAPEQKHLEAQGIADHNRTVAASLSRSPACTALRQAQGRLAAMNASNASTSGWP